MGAKSKNTKTKPRSNSVKNAQNIPEGSDAAENEEAPKKKKKPSKHTWEGTYLLKKHKPGCVNRHISYYANPGRNTCSHRGQARERAKADYERYLWDPGTSGKDPWDPREAGNFQKSASTPFPHEAHHVVAAAELKNAMINASKGVEPENSILQMMRGGLLKEKYNVNDRVNMLILPMDVEATKRLGLPLHRKTVDHRNHTAYSTFIESKLQEAFSWLQSAADKHEVPPYQATKEKIETLSERTYTNILLTGEALKGLDGGDLDLDSLTDRIKKLGSGMGGMSL